MKRKIFSILMSLALVFTLGLMTALPVGAADITVGGSAYATIQEAVDAASPGDTITVAAGTYTENVTINKQLFLISASGREVTTIQGDTALGGELGTVFVTNNTDGVQIGDIGQGFTIIGIDGPPGLEKAAVYFQGGHSNAVIKGNNIVANGDAGLLTEWGATITGFVISDNEFSGQTFVGNNPGGDGFGTQFTTPNVPRQLANMGGGAGGGNTSNITFTGNHITGTAGGINIGSNPQGNTLITIDSVGSTITGNVFEGTTTRYGTSLRARGPNATITGNDFRSTGLTLSNGHLLLVNNPIDSALIAANTFDKGVYVEDASGGTIGLSIQGFVSAVPEDTTINVLAGIYREYLHITTDGLTIEGAGIDESIIDLEGLIPYWHYTGGSFASRAGVLITGYGSPDGIIEGVTFSGFTVKNAGLNPPITATGTHDGADNAAVLTDSTASWTDDELVGQWVHNVSDKLIEIDISGNTPIRSYGLITANTATTVTATLAGGLDNDWDAGDTYVVIPYEQYVDVAEDLQDDVRGISIGNGKDVSILYCKVINSGYGGITAGKARIGGLHSEGVTIDHCISSDHPQVGISVGDHLGPVTITNNTCSNNKRPHPTDPSREYAGVGIQVSGSSSLPISGLIAGNTCNGNGFEGILLKNYSNGVVVENNTVTGSNFDEDGAGIFFYGKSSDPENCQNNIIRNNTVTGNIRGIVAYYAQYCLIEGNTITTDSGAFASGQAAIKIDGGNNITVKDNIISCDGVGIKVQNTWNDVESFNNTFTGNTITGAMFAGVFISDGAHDNMFENNTITGTTTLTRWAGEDYEDTQGDGVLIYDDAGTGNVFHYNNIYGNAGDGMENQTTTIIDALYNWWGYVTGPSHGILNPGAQGNAVSDNVDFSPWLYGLQQNFVSDAPFYAGSVVLDNVTSEVTVDGAIIYVGGWNSFSTPVTLASSANTLGELSLPFGSVVLRFDLDKQEWVVPELDYQIKPGEGFFIQMRQQWSLPILCSTTPTSPPMTDLVAGWNLVGLSNLTSMSVADALHNISYNVVLSASPPNDSAWSVPPADTTTNMVLGEAYWVAISQSGILFGFTWTPVAVNMTWELN